MLDKLQNGIDARSQSDISLSCVYTVIKVSEIS